MKRINVLLSMVVSIGILGTVSCDKKMLDFGEAIEGARIELNIMDFGATGDGVTDDSHAVVAALDTINAHPENRYILRFPEGTYPVNVEVNADSLEIVGDGLLIPASGY